MPEEIQTPPCKCRRVDGDKVVHLEECDLHDPKDCAACRQRWTESERHHNMYLRHSEGYEFRGAS